MMNDRDGRSFRLPRAGFFLCALALAGALGTALATARAAVASPSCSWAGETDQRDVNIGAPDSDAFYWLSPITPAPGTEVLISGQYPRSRYFSFHVYDEHGQALDSIYDRQIEPHAGSANPFRGRQPAGSGDAYQVTVRFEPKPASPAANTIYAGEPGSNAGALLVYRDYVPVDPSSPEGSVPFPQVTVATTAGVPLVQEGACSVTPPAFGSLLWQTFAEGNYPDGLPNEAPAAASAPPHWARAFGSSLGNQQNAYLETVLSHAYGQIAVVHTRAPTFPNTSAGQPVYRNTQLRYWSFCSYDAEGEALVGCAADYHTVIRSGQVTFVISDPEHRPANATAASGVTWLPWGAQSAAQIVYRNMLPSPTFPYAAESITSPTQSVQETMGPYYPATWYCAKATFEAGGWAACKRESERA
jgi:hypothetical protein